MGNEKVMNINKLSSDILRDCRILSRQVITKFAFLAL